MTTASPPSTTSAPIEKTELGWAVGAVTWLAILWLAGGIAGEPDLWGHLRFGLDVIAGRALPVVDPYSFTQDRPILYHEWLGAVLLAVAYHVGGFSAILILKLAVILASFFIIWRAWRHVQPPVTLVVLVIAALGAAPLTRTTRPQMWTLLCLMVLLTQLQRPPSVRRVVLIAALFIAWLNLHGGVVLGLGILGVWCAVSAIESWRQTRAIPWLWLVTPIVAAAATIVNPYGINYWAFLLETVRPGRDITEWQPLWMQPPQLWVPFLLALIGVCVWRLWPGWPGLAVMLMLWYAGITVSRIAYLAVPATVLLSARAAAVRWPRAAWQWRAPSSAAAMLMAIPLIAIAVAVWPVVQTPFTCIPIGEQDPAGLARLEATRSPGRLVVWFDWGQYAIWHVSPRLKISWDGRRETLYSEHTQETQKAVAFGLPEGDRWLATVRPEYVWMPAAFAARRAWLKSNGYRLDHDTAVSFIAVREDLPPLPEATPRGSCVQESPPAY